MDTDADRVRIVRAEAQRLEQFLRALTPEEWQRPSACDRWQVADVVAHLTGMDIAGHIARGLQGDVTPPAGGAPIGSVNEDAFRERIAQGSMALRAQLGDDLLSAYIATNARLDQALAGLHPQDWETRCYHPMGAEPVRTWIDMRITELAMHSWDIRSSFDPQASLSADSLPALCQTIPRAVRRAFRPDEAQSAPVRYRFAVTTPYAITQDIVLSREGGRCERPSETLAAVTFRCTTDTYVLIMFGRLAVETALREGLLAFEGDPARVTAFGQSFVGG